ncbi:MAG: hypothetical protein G01um101433_591 [Parcubacteria group bacterium Gr01-1014_33]|nr:MAG: hypothetical protein G01um101433_591 [Parcubacteria group bacterium Gr01-1014_33]
MKFKNWPEIFKIENDDFRRLLIKMEEEDILEGLAQGFPSLFSDEYVAYRIPASLLLEEAEEDAREEHEHSGKEYRKWYGTVVLAQILKSNYGIEPHFDWGDEDEGNIPEEVRIQLVGQKMRPFLPVTYRGVKCVVVDWYGGDFEDHKRYPLGREISRHSVDQLKYLTLVASRHIDLEA